MSRSETESNALEGQAPIQRPLGSPRDLTRLGRPKGEEPPHTKFPIGGSIIRNSPVNSPVYDSNEPLEETEAEIRSVEFSRISAIV